MKLVIETDERIQLAFAGESFEIDSEGPALSPYHLLAGSLASCTALTLTPWAEGAGVDMTPLTIQVSWVKADEKPARIDRMDMEIRWPGLPENRIEAAVRIADLCPIHATLKRSAEIATRVVA